MFLKLYLGRHPVGLNHQDPSAKKVFRAAGLSDRDPTTGLDQSSSAPLNRSVPCPTRRTTATSHLAHTSPHTYTLGQDLSKCQRQDCTEMTYCGIADFLSMLMASSKSPAVTARTRHRIELRPHATEKVVALVLGHASYGLL